MGFCDNKNAKGWSFHVACGWDMAYVHVPYILGMHCKKLTSLDISRVSATPRSLKMMTQHCNALKVCTLAMYACEAGKQFYLQTLIIKGCHSVGEKRSV